MAESATSSKSNNARVSRAVACALRGRAAGKGLQKSRGRAVRLHVYIRWTPPEGREDVLGAPNMVPAGCFGLGITWLSTGKT